MPLIDAHVHLYPAEVDRDPAAWAAAQGEKHWSVLCTRRRRDGRPVQTLPTVAGLFSAMDAAGVEKAVLLGWYWENVATCAWQNRFYADMVRAHPDRLSAFATIHPAAGATVAVAEMRRARDEGLIGLGELSPHSQGFAVTDPDFQAVLVCAAELNWPVNLHVTDPASRPFPRRVETPPAAFLWLARQHPQTTFILAHWGGLLPLTNPAFGALRNIYYDTAASPLLYGSGVWSRATGALGADRVLFGSDFPLNLYPKLDESPGLVRLVQEARSCGLSDAVLGGNAARLLRL
jgi:predicted TIM-barrel fold metal-dependent hydrolase